jgi:DNA-binding response OmpR family regulator
MNDAVTIVMIEDDEGHARLIEKNIRRAGVMNDLIHVPDGASAFRFFETFRGSPPGAKPLLILLDLNLPDMSGIDILVKLKADATLHRAPVIDLTTADDGIEVQNCYDLGCNVYITKPVDYEQFATAIRQLGLFFSVIQVPEPA